MSVSLPLHPPPHSRKCSTAHCAQHTYCVYARGSADMPGPFEFTDILLSRKPGVTSGGHSNLRTFYGAGNQGWPLISFSFLPLQKCFPIFFLTDRGCFSHSCFFAWKRIGYRRSGQFRSCRKYENTVTKKIFMFKKTWRQQKTLQERKGCFILPIPVLKLEGFQWLRLVLFHFLDIAVQFCAGLSEVGVMMLS